MNKFVKNDWRFTSIRAPILSSAEMDSVAAKLGKAMPLPDMLFGNNHLTLEHIPTGLKLDFNPVDALERVVVGGDADKLIKVLHADKWKANSNNENDKVVKSYDWTFSSDYSGTLTGPSTYKFEPTTEGIDIEKLKKPEQILFYDELLLFEDELHDNGVCVLNVRTRVMSSCFFVLQRQFLRVDGVLFRINDTRIFHEFGTNTLIREFSTRQIEYDKIKARVPKLPPWHPSRVGAGPGVSGEDLSALTDAHWVADIMNSATTPTTQTIERVVLPSTHADSAFQQAFLDALPDSLISLKDLLESLTSDCDYVWKNIIKTCSYKSCRLWKGHKHRQNLPSIIRKEIQIEDGSYPALTDVLAEEADAVPV